MLKALTVKNYALIDSLSINFDKGFSVITGETGAGKSIIIGALSLILGKRADTGVLKEKSVKCIIEGEFDISKLNLKPFFDNNDLDYDSLLIIRREILPTGKSRAFVNDTPVNLNILKELGSQLVDIHSQHQTLMLGDSGFQLETLDSFLKLNNTKEDYKKVYKQYSEIKKELENLKIKEEELKRDEDYLEFQLSEFEDVNLDADEFRGMEERMEFLTHAGDVAEALSALSFELTDDEINIIDKLSFLKDRLESVAGYFPKAAEFRERINSVRIELKDLSEEAYRLKADTEFNPAEMEEIEEKLNRIYKLQQKHRADSIEELINIKNEFEEKLFGISSLDEKISELEEKLKKSEKELTALAENLSLLRKKGSGKFSSSILTVLKKLGMNDSVFEVKIESLNDFSINGKDKITFLFNANPGATPGEVSKIASGGELSRLMLAIKSLITESRLLPTVVFDEIDSGVSGDIAGKTGNIMKEMAKHHQLLVISHLPQIAAKADAHYKVFKETKSGITATNIISLDENSRLIEIAAMLSDEKITEASKQAAKELLN